MPVAASGPGPGRAPRIPSMGAPGHARRVACRVARGMTCRMAGLVTCRMTGVVACRIAGVDTAGRGLRRGEASLEAGRRGHEGLVARGEIRRQVHVRIDCRVPEDPAVRRPVPVVGQDLVLLRFHFLFEPLSIIFPGCIRVAVPDLLLELCKDLFEEVSKNAREHKAPGVE